MIDVVITVDDADAYAYRHPNHVVRALESVANPTQFGEVRSLIVVDRSTGLTSIWHEGPGA